MGVFDVDLLKIREIVYALLLTLIVAIAGGLLFIAVFFRHFFNTVDNYRLSMVSIAIVIPVVFFNSIWLIILGELEIPVPGKEKPKEMALILFAGSLLSIPCLYLPVAVGYFFNIKAKYGVGIVAMLELLLLCRYLYVLNIRIKEKRGYVPAK